MPSKRLPNKHLKSAWRNQELRWRKMSTSCRGEFCETFSIFYFWSWNTFNLIDLTQMVIFFLILQEFAKWVYWLWGEIKEWPRCLSEVKLNKNTHNWMAIHEYVWLYQRCIHIWEKHSSWFYIYLHVNKII